MLLRSLNEIRTDILEMELTSNAMLQCCIIRQTGMSDMFHLVCSPINLNIYVTRIAVIRKKMHIHESLFQVFFFFFFLPMTEFLCILLVSNGSSSEGSL